MDRVTLLIIVLWSLVGLFGLIFAYIWFTGWATKGGKVYRYGQKDASVGASWTQVGGSEETEDIQDEKVEDQEVKA